MPRNKNFNIAAHEIANWLTDYFEHVEDYPVLPQVSPGDIEKQLPIVPPEKTEDYKQILDDFNQIIMPGITHWQHPGFHAYFPANTSEPSVLAEMLMAGLGVQGMKWITSPAATELEKVVMRWLQQMIGLPDSFKGVIMDTASVSTLCAVLAAREKASSYTINEDGFGDRVLRVYCSEQAHSSIEKAVRISGIGSTNLVKVPVDNDFALLPDKLEKAIIQDIKSGYIPTCVVGALGTTGSGAIDPLKAVGKICHKHNIWFHIDAAYSGSALILPEFRNTIEGLDLADSFVFNPHKWLFTNFDNSAFFVRNSNALTRTFSLVPEYLQTGHGEELDFSNWGIQLGRRFRSLKLWFVIRHYGVEGLQAMIREHIRLGELFEQLVLDDRRFELLAPRSLNIICFRFKDDLDEKLNATNKTILDACNASEKIFLSHTEIDGKFAIRFVCGQTKVEERHIHKAWEIIASATTEIIQNGH